MTRRPRGAEYLFCVQLASTPQHSFPFHILSFAMPPSVESSLDRIWAALQPLGFDLEKDPCPLPDGQLIDVFFRIASDSVSPDFSLL
jgi:hypothetical protein